MNAIVKKLLAMVGLKRLLRIAWLSVIYPALKKYVKETEDVKWDDNFLEFLNGVVLLAIERL